MRTRTCAVLTARRCDLRLRAFRIQRIPESQKTPTQTATARSPHHRAVAPPQPLSIGQDDEGDSSSVWTAQDRYERTLKKIMPMPAISKTESTTTTTSR